MNNNESDEDSEDDSINSKVIFVGDLATGKTEIILRILGNPFEENLDTTMGADFMIKYIKFKGQNIKIQLWDTNGSERMKRLMASYIKNSSIVFVVYAVSYRETFDNVPKWISFLKRIGNKVIVLCGNKIDLKREVETNEGEQLAKNEGILFFECSAKTNENIKNMFFYSIGFLPIFGIDNNPNVIEELMEENDFGDFDFQKEKENHYLVLLHKGNNSENKKISKKRKRKCA